MNRKLLGTSWQTTLAGIGLGLFPIGQTVLETIQTGQPVEWSQVGLGIGLMIFGRLSKFTGATGKGN